MNEFNKQILKTGAKRVIATTSLAALLFTGIPTIAYADVNPSFIVGDLQLSEDRTEAKRNDAELLKARFATNIITLEEIEKAINLSNVLNAYSFDGYNYTNTTPLEMFTVDVNELQSQYEKAKENNQTVSFCANNLTNRPACDGYITLSSKKVADELRTVLGTRVGGYYTATGKTINKVPTIIIDGQEISCYIQVNGWLKKIIITGDNIKEVISSIKALDNMYNTAMNNLSGHSTITDGSFRYNGVNSLTQESVYFSIGDDDKKEAITSGINYARNLGNTDVYSFTVGDQYTGLTETEKNIFRQLGYTEKEISKGIKQFVQVTKNVEKTLNK